MTYRKYLTAVAMGYTFANAGGLAAQTAAAQATQETKSVWEFRAPSGGLVQTGAQRGVIKDATLSAAQLSYAIRPSIAITGTFGWARSRDLVTANDPKLDVFTYDVGAEARAPKMLIGKAVTFSPFAGAGAGARSYNYRKLDVDATHNVAGYGAVGGDLGRGRFGLRLEVRDYVAAFKPLNGPGAAQTRNDVAIMAGLSVSHKHTSRN